MFRQDVGSEMYLVVRSDKRYQIETKVVWGAKDTETNWGERGYLVLVDPGEEYNPKPDNAMVFRHGEDLSRFAAAFDEYEIARSVCDHLNR